MPCEFVLQVRAAVGFWHIILGHYGGAELDLPDVICVTNISLSTPTASNVSITKPTVSSVSLSTPTAASVTLTDCE